MDREPPITPPYRLGERAVSPVIGVVLMVAITIILAAMIAAFVMGMAPGQATSPIVSVGISEADGTGTLSLVHDGGDTLELDDHTLLVNGSSTHGNDSMTGTLQSGQRVLVSDLAPTEDADVALRHDPSGEIIARTTITIEE